MFEEEKFEFIDKNINIIKIFNTILILVAVGLNAYSLFMGEDILITDKIFFISTLVALMFGMVYTHKGYRKEDVKTYNIFIILCMLTLLLQLSGEVYWLITIGVSILKPQLVSIFSISLEIVILSIIAWIKDIGGKASIILVSIILFFSIFSFLRSVALYSGSSGYIALSFSGVVLSCIVFIFVAVKYRNEANQETE